MARTARRQSTRRGEPMRGLGRRTGWLGWVVAGVLLLSAGGVALAAQSSPSTMQAPGVTADKQRAGFWVGGPGGGHGLARRDLPRELTLPNRDGVKPVLVARGELTDPADARITVKSSDGVST